MTRARRAENESAAPPAMTPAVPAGEGALAVCAPPAPPGWRVDWAAAEAAFPLLRALFDCPQEPAFHAEGDAGTHTRMVAEALAALPAWRALPALERAMVYAAALLHDTGKPDTTRLEMDGRLVSRGHARRGSILARQTLWRLGVPFALREQVAALVRHHTALFHAIEAPDPVQVAARISYAARCDHLALLGEADARGRRCLDPDDMTRALEAVALFGELCREAGCLDRPYRFPSDHARFRYFQGLQPDPSYRPYEDFRAEVVVMSGLPGSGKDHWLRTHLPDWPVVGLDTLRASLGVAPTADQRPVLAQAHTLAREHLLQHRHFVWNATNLSRQIRGECIGYLAAYGARVRLVYLEVPEARLLAQNRARERQVPEGVLRRMLDRWEVPDLTEAHALEVVVDEEA